MTKTCEENGCYEVATMTCAHCGGYFCYLHGFDADEWNEGDEWDIEKGDCICLECSCK